MSTNPYERPSTHPGVSHHVTQDHAAIVQGSREGLAGGDVLSHLWHPQEAGTSRPTGAHPTVRERLTDTDRSRDTWGRPETQEHMDRHMDTRTQRCKDTQLSSCPFHHAPACIKRLLCAQHCACSHALPGEAAQLAEAGQRGLQEEAGLRAGLDSDRMGKRPARGRACGRVWAARSGPLARPAHTQASEKGCLEGGCAEPS